MPNNIKFNKAHLRPNAKLNILKVLKNKKFADGEFQSRAENQIKKLVKAKFTN